MNQDSRSLHTRSSSHGPSLSRVSPIRMPQQPEGEPAHNDPLSDTELLASPVDYEALTTSNFGSNLRLDTDPMVHEDDPEWGTAHASLRRELSEPEDPAEEVAQPDPATFLSLYFSQQETARSQGLLHEDSDSAAEDDYKFRFTHVSNSGASAAAAPHRGRSAPARPLTDVETFRTSKEFLCLEAAALATTDLLLKTDGKLDLDSVEGNNNCKNFLTKIEDLIAVFQIKSSDRSYRDTFSQPYKALYKEGSLCYLTEILDSAQEGLPYILVNSEKYIFSANVLATGEQLYTAFVKLKMFLRDVYDLYCFFILCF